MRRLPALLVAALVMAACAPENPPSASSSTSRPSVSTSSAATSAPSTTTTVPIASTVALDDPQEHVLLFDVTGIESGSIVGYEGAGTNFPEVATFRAGTVALQGTGLVDESIDGTVWREIATGGGTTAWVDDGFLSPNTSARVSFADQPCSGFGTPAGELARSAPGSDRADHVAQIWQTAWPDCTRVVIALGEDFAFDLSGPLAEEVPGDVAVEAFGTWARVTLTGIDLARPDATEDLGDMTVVVARSEDGRLVADIHTGAPAEFFAQFLADPARIVVDILPANVAAVVVAPPVLGDAVIVPEALPPMLELPITITGYSRWFEAGGLVVVRRLDKEPGVGEVVGAILRGPMVLGEGAGTEWGLAATDWLDAWGLFSFELDGLAAGDYEVFIGECRMAEDSDECVDVGAYLPVSIGS